MLSDDTSHNRTIHRPASGAAEIGESYRMTAVTSVLTDLERYAIALDSMPSETVLSHRSAAVVWGLWIPSFREIEVTTAARAAGSRYTTSSQPATGRCSLARRLRNCYSAALP
jgi:hypothetical protein